MAANTSAIFSRLADIQWGTLIQTANTAKDGTGTVVTIFTADATNGGRIERIAVRAAGTNVISVMRFFVNNGLTNATAANNSLIFELLLAATTLNEAAALADPSVVGTSFFPLVLPIGYKLNITLGTTVAAGYYVTAIGGKY